MYADDFGATARVPHILRVIVPDTDRKDVPEIEARAKPLPRRLPLAGAPPDLVPARMVNEVVYCERLMYLEWSQGEFEDNAFTVDGRAVHARADVASGALPPPAAAPSSEGVAAAEEEDDDDDGRARPYEARSLWLSSEKLGVTAKIDVVEGDASGAVVPIEYKRGAAPDVPEGAYAPERAQLCVQVLLLREHGYACDHGEIYFARSKRRVAIAIDDALVARTLEAIRRAKELASRVEIPPPLVDSPKCNGCSLVGICLPDETSYLCGERAAREDAPAAPPEAMEAFWPESADETPAVGDEVVLRRLVPARDDRLPLYVEDQGAKIGLSGDELVIRTRDGDETRARLTNLSQVTLFGNVQMSTQAIRAVLERGLAVAFLTSGGWFTGRATGTDSKNVELRVAQHRVFADEPTCVRLARRVVATKIRNCRTMVRRNIERPGTADVELFELEQLATKAEACDSLASLLGIEGTAARTYFGKFSSMLGGKLADDFEMDGRNRRPPRDPINALLSLSYSLLTKELAHTIASAGLDPLLGFYHQPRFGRPALALDLMEELRPLVGDSTVLQAVNNGVIGQDDFVRHPTGVALKAPARKRFILAYERRMDQLVTHPVFGYRVSYRRVIEVQVRLLGRFLLGEIPEYPELRTR